MIEIDEFLKKISGMNLADGNLLDADAKGLIEVAKKAARPGCLFVDIGPWKGKSTLCLAAVAAQNEGKVLAIDHWLGSSGTQTEKLAASTDIFSVFKTNMELVDGWLDVVYAWYMPHEFANVLMKNNLIDLVFLDADNRYEHYSTAISLWLPRLRSEGIICGRNHRIDYNSETEELIEQAIGLEFLPEVGIHPGIIKAVHDVFGANYHKIPETTIWYWQKG